MDLSALVKTKKVQLGGKRKSQVIYICYKLSGGNKHFNLVSSPQVTNLLNEIK